MKLSNIRDGFTLAEVLITLGIIGVVAAMTMPTLINQTNGAQYKAAYKKALSAISQAVTLNVALEDISFADATATSFLPNRMNVVKTVTGLGDKDTTDNAYLTALPTGLKPTASNTTLFFNDGSAFSFLTAANACTHETANGTLKECHGFIDVNGAKGPNKVVLCDGVSNQTKYKETVANCTVSSPTDIYPVVYYDQTILPATDAARAVLYGK